MRDALGEYLGQEIVVEGKFFRYGSIEHRRTILLTDIRVDDNFIADHLWVLPTFVPDNIEFGAIVKVKGTVRGYNKTIQNGWDLGLNNSKVLSYSDGDFRVPSAVRKLGRYKYELAYGDRTAVVTKRGKVLSAPAEHAQDVERWIKHCLSYCTD